ncbi:MAG: 4-hydroxybenzoate octaprenyltransferase [Gammaproteobacteria bacterium]|nr:4-hydroxybenzoate octaprenyltransferase [Gammaproteobacteria bacterium]
MRQIGQSLPPWYERIPDFIQLMRLDRPIGILLLLWPTLWALWIAGEGSPDYSVVFIFCMGVVLMRSAGCVVNDFADRKIDGEVERTKNRPLATGRITSREALTLFGLLMGLAFFLVLFTNIFTILLSFGAALLAASYPFMKRYTHFPQVALGAAFAWSIPMSFAGQTNSLPSEVWIIYGATLIWTVAYDTMYAMVDREDDLRIGVKSTAIIFGRADKLIIGCLQLATLLLLVLLGLQLELGVCYYLGLLVAAGLFVHQQALIKNRDRDACFEAFLNNNQVGMAIFIGLFLDYLFV